MIEYQDLIFFIGLYHEFVSLPKHQRYVEAYFPIEDHHNIPKVKDMLKNISLILVNAHFTFGYPKPTLPHIIQIAGLHITEPSPLPEVNHTFIIISMKYRSNIYRYQRSYLLLIAR